MDAHKSNFSNNLYVWCYKFLKAVVKIHKGYYRERPYFVKLSKEHHLKSVQKILASTFIQSQYSDRFCTENLIATAMKIAADIMMYTFIMRTIYYTRKER